MHRLNTTKNIVFKIYSFNSRKTVKRNKNKLIIVSINAAKNIILYSKYILLTREKL